MRLRHRLIDAFALVLLVAAWLGWYVATPASPITHRAHVSRKAAP